MKMTKNLLALVGGVAILASVFVFTSCSEDEAGNDFIEISGRNATAQAENTASSGYYRGYKSLASTQWHGGAYVIKMNVADPRAAYKSTGGGAVLGLTFDGSNYKNTSGVEVNDFYLLGLRYNGTNAEIYLSRFEGVTGTDLAEGLTTSSSFGTEYQMINGSSTAFASLKDVKPMNNVITLSVVVYQNCDETGKYTGKYGIAIYSGDVLTGKNLKVQEIAKGQKSLKDVLGSDPINLSMATVANGNGGKLLTSKNGCSSDDLTDFGTLTDKDGKTITGDDQGRFGFYGNIYAGGVLDGSFTCVDYDLEAEVVEE